MAKKEFAVFGLGSFGSSIAISLEQHGCEVLAVDRDEEMVREIAPFVTNAICADVSDKKTMASFGVGNMDGVIVAIGCDLEASIFATILAKESGAGFVLAKAANDVHAEVLKKVGADRVVFPEKDMGHRLGRNLAAGNLLDLIELSKKFSLIEVETPASWEGKSLLELELRKRGINVIARKTKKDELQLALDPNQKLVSGETYIIVGNNKDLERELG